MSSPHAPTWSSRSRSTAPTVVQVRARARAPALRSPARCRQTKRVRKGCDTVLRVPSTRAPAALGLPFLSLLLWAHGARGASCGVFVLVIVGTWCTGCKLWVFCPCYCGHMVHGVQVVGGLAAQSVAVHQVALCAHFCTHTHTHTHTNTHHCSILDVAVRARGSDTARSLDL